MLTLYLLLNWLPTLLLGYGLDKRHAAFAQIAFNLGGAVAALFVGRLLDSPYRRRSTVAVFTAVPISLGCLALAPQESSVIVFIVLWWGRPFWPRRLVMYAMAPQCYPTRIRGDRGGHGGGRGAGPDPSRARHWREYGWRRGSPPHNC